MRFFEVFYGDSPPIFVRRVLHFSVYVAVVPIFRGLVADKTTTIFRDLALLGGKFIAVVTAGVSAAICRDLAVEVPE